ncbi:MAG: XRE family transcriptional regulator [Hansschlegelia sp.]
MAQADPTAAEAFDGPDDLAREFGERVRMLRDRAGMTLDQLAVRSGVSRAMLSKVERGEKSPTIGVATRISHALGTSLSYLTGGDGERASTVLVRLGERPIFRDPQTGFERHILSPPIAGAAVELLYHRLPPGASTGRLPAYPRGTEKQIVVTEGELTVAMRDAEHRVGTGDAFFFEANVDHAFDNRSEAPCGYYLVVARRSL